MQLKNSLVILAPHDLYGKVVWYLIVCGTSRHEILRRHCKQVCVKKYLGVRKIYLGIHAFNPKFDYFERKQELNPSLLVIINLVIINLF